MSERVRPGQIWRWCGDDAEVVVLVLRSARSLVTLGNGTAWYCVIYEPESSLQESIRSFYLSSSSWELLSDV